jgi:HD-like signal output (HDOD) protein
MNPAAEKLFEQAFRLPQIPHVTQQVIKSLRNEDVSIKELVDLVGNDQVIVAKVLRLANSSYYGAGRNVTSVGSAVKLLGLNIFRNLVIASSLVSTFPKADGFDLPAFWRNSMLVANLAHIVGRDLDIDRGMLFSAGLMHGIGQLLIYLCMPNAARTVADECKCSRLEQQRMIEQRLLQMDHFEVGMELARRWHFPGTIQAVIGHYDAPGDNNLPGQVVHCAVKIAQGIQAGSTLGDMLAGLPPDMAKRLRLDKDWFEEEGEVFDLLLAESASLASGH